MEQNSQISGADLSHPEGDKLVLEALEILKQIPSGAKLIALQEQQSIQIKAIRSPQELSYLPDNKEIFIGFPPGHEPSLTRLVLVIAGALRDIEQNLLGLSHKTPEDPVEDQAATAYAKKADKVVRMCAVAYELAQHNDFTEQFIDEMHEMGYGEVMESYVSEQQS